MAKKPVLIGSQKKPPEHNYDAVFSITRMHLGGTLVVHMTCQVTVWRKQEDIGPWHLSDLDLDQAVEGMHPSAYREIAQKLIAMPRVKVVEVFCPETGMGIRIEDD